MADTNQGVVYTGPGRVEVQDLDYPKLELPEQNNRQLQHGVILKIVATNICGSDQHMVRGGPPPPRARPSATRSPARSPRSAATSSSSSRVTWSACRSTSPAGAAATVRSATPASARTSTRHGPEPPTAMSTWAAGWAARPST